MDSRDSLEDKAIDLLFQRPLDPSFITRDNGKALLELPDELYPERYRGVSLEVQSRFGDNVEVKIPLRNITKPNIDFTKKIGVKQHFSLFLEEHQKIAGRLIQLFMEQPDKSTFISIATFVKDRVNPFLFQYAYSVAVQHRSDTKGITIPAIAEQFPSNFVEPSVFKDARAEGTLITDPGNRVRINIPRSFTASEREPEQRLAYFREDIGINMHHWHWHLVYPTSGPREVVDKDRRGELFYYMHHQILARYNAERFSNLLPKIRVLNNLREPVEDAYFPKILSSLNNRTYPGRNPGVILQDVERENNVVEIADLERWRDRLHQAIDQGYVTDGKGTNIPLDDKKGIDLLGNLIEASDLSVNRQLYGNLHNMGHNIIAISHDPDNRFLEDFSVMGDVTTAMRDPIFYRWHAFVDGIFNKHKATLPEYKPEELSNEGIEVQGIELKIDTGKSAAANVLLTFWQKSDVDLAAALDFGPNGNIYAHFTHLQHAPFTYTIQVTNKSGAARQGTCRIFMCPQADERGTALKFNEQRQLMIEMDKFTVNLNPGENVVKRRSDDSSVTIPFERSFRRIGPAFQPKDQNRLTEFQFCGCGWPQHLLIPRGTAEGMPFDFYVMISNYADDQVTQTNDSPDVCGDSASYCGLKDKLYPDKRSMGFPFDRSHQSTTLGEFTASYPNMAVQQVVIKYNNQVINKM